MLPKKFLHLNPEILEISKPQFIIGVTLGILFSFGFYSITSVIKEILRVLSTTENYDIWLLSESEQNFYNLFYAFLSAIFGQSICFSFWLSKKRKTFGKQNYLRSSVIVDQSVLNSYFLLWFSKMAFFFAAFFGLNRWGGVLCIQFLPKVQLLIYSDNCCIVSSNLDYYQAYF